MLRHSSRRLGAVAQSSGHSPPALINPISNPDFPRGHERVFGKHQSIWSHSYKFWRNEYLNGPYKPTYIAGGVHDPTIDPLIHFNTQDRWETVPKMKMVEYYLHGVWMGRGVVFALLLPVFAVASITALEHRREPLELTMDREEYYRDFDSHHWGVYFDHHHFSHQLAHRRANKWGYEDITLGSH